MKQKKRSEIEVWAGKLGGKNSTINTNEENLEHNIHRKKLDSQIS